MRWRGILRLVCNENIHTRKKALHWLDNLRPIEVIKCLKKNKGVPVRAYNL
jgi:hypothetical protein